MSETKHAGLSTNSKVLKILKTEIWFIKGPSLNKTGVDDSTRSVWFSENAFRYESGCMS